MLKRGKRYTRVHAVSVGYDSRLREEIIAYRHNDVLLIPRRKWAKRPRDSNTISVRLAKEDELRLLALAEKSGVTKHAIMKEAIRRHLDRAEAEDWLRNWPEAAPSELPENDRDDAAAVSVPANDRALFAYRAVMPGTGLTEIMAGHIARGMNRLRAIRGGRGFSLGRLAARLEDLGVGVGETVLAEIEAGKATPSPKLLAALAKTLGVAVDDLVG